MEVGLNRLLKGPARALRVLIAGFLIFAGLLSASPAHAEEADPSTYAYTIAGTMLQEETPIPGIKVTATLGDFSASTTSNEWGEWSIMVPELGQYQVEIDKSTIPEGFALTDAENGALGIADLSETDFAAVLFSFGADTSVDTSFSDLLIARIFAGLNFGLLLAIASIGISLIYGTTGLNNFAHGEMVSLGALIMWITYIVLDQNILLAALLSIAAVTAFGWAQDAGIWKPLRKRRMGLNQMMIVSIGFSIVARYLLLLFFGGDTKDIGGGGNIIELGPIFTSDITLIGMAINVIALAGVALFLTRTRVGKATRAVSDNASLAASTGIDVERIIRIVWLFAAALTGLAGVLYGLQFQASWLTGFDILLLLFAAVTLGGLGTALGATVGALIIGMVVEVSTLFIPNELKYAAALVILVIILIVRPQGVLGKKQRIG
ncbi:MAG: branched-chain amino acid ABC transporter permease [Actinobacteria bacterium]|nr:branched-chain amino acid ABC transporter permease [Actinomycetota bacterium]